MITPDVLRGRALDKEVVKSPPIALPLLEGGAWGSIYIDTSTLVFPYSWSVHVAIITRSGQRSRKTGELYSSLVYRKLSDDMPCHASTIREGKIRE